jgi:hypothetical protein
MNCSVKQIALGVLLATFTLGWTGVAHAELISHWAAEENAADNLGVNSGLLVNNVGFGSGAVGQAFQFSGTNYVQS